MIKSTLWEWVPYIVFITIIVNLNNERYILCYYILNYDENHTYNIHVSYIYFIINCFTNLESVICFHLYHNCFEAVKEQNKVPCSISIYIGIGKFMIPVTSEQPIPNSRSIGRINRLCWVRYQYSFKPSTSDKLL